jgi:ankyrin repeat protein
MFESNREAADASGHVARRASEAIQMSSTLCLMLLTLAGCMAGARQGSAPAPASGPASTTAAPPATTRPCGESELAIAADSGDLDRVRRLIGDRVQLNPADPDQSPLVRAAANRHREVAEFLIRHGARVNACGNFGTALHWAAMTGDVELAQFLLDHGANPSISSRAAGTPLHRAADGCSPEMADLLIRRGAKVNAKADDGSTPLMWSILPARYDRRARQVVRFLLDHGADVNVTDSRTDTPLSLARESGDNEIVQMLTAHGAR